MKRGDSSRYRGDNKDQHEGSQKDEDNIPPHLQSAIGEIKTITGGPSTGGSFKSLKKSYEAGEQCPWPASLKQRWTN